VFEPIAVLYLTRQIALFISPFNLWLGGLLGVLLGLNLALVAHALHQRAEGRRPSLKGAAVALPGLLLGLACRAPTLLVLLGSTSVALTSGPIAVRACSIRFRWLGLLIATYALSHGIPLLAGGADFDAMRAAGIPLGAAR
jgi:hypothetical protein